MADETTPAAAGKPADDAPAERMVEAAKLDAALAEIAEWKTKAMEARGAAVERDRLTSDLEKMRGDLEAAKAEAAKAEIGRTRALVGLAHGLTREHVDLFLTGDDEATLEAQAKALADMRGAAVPAPRAPKPAPEAARGEAPLALNGDIEGALRRRLGMA